MDISVELAMARIAEYTLYRERKRKKTGKGKEVTPLLDKAKEKVQRYHEEYLKLTSPSTANRTRFG